MEHHEEEEVEVEEEGERAEAECSPTTPQQPGHWDTEGVATSNKGGDDPPHCHGDEIQHDLAECDITRSPGHSAHLPPSPAIPSQTAQLQPPPTALATPPPPTMATSTAPLPPGVTTTAGSTSTPTLSVVVPGLFLPPSFSVCVPSMNWRAQSFAKVFGLNALPIKLLPSRGGPGALLGGGNGGQMNDGQKEGRTKRVGGLVRRLCQFFRWFFFPLSFPPSYLLCVSLLPSFPLFSPHPPFSLLPSIYFSIPPLPSPPPSFPLPPPSET